MRISFVQWIISHYHCVLLFSYLTRYAGFIINIKQIEVHNNLYKPSRFNKKSNAEFNNSCRLTSLERTVSFRVSFTLESVSIKSASMKNVNGVQSWSQEVIMCLNEVRTRKNTKCFGLTEVVKSWLQEIRSIRSGRRTKLRFSTEGTCPNQRIFDFAGVKTPFAYKTISSGDYNISPQYI